MSISAEVAEWIQVEIAMRPRYTPEQRRRVVEILCEPNAQ